MVDVQLFQPERLSDNKDGTSPNPMVHWGPEEKSWAQNPTCRQVGNQIICDNIYGDNKPDASRASFSLQGGNSSFHAIADLQASMGLFPSTARVSDTQAPPYFPSGTLPNPNYGNSSFDQFGFNQGPKDQVRPGGTAVGPAWRPFDPFSFNQGDKTPISPIAPINPGIIPPYIKPNGHDVPAPPPPKPIDVPLPPIPGPVGPPKPIDVPVPPSPAPQPQPDVNPYQPCQPQPYQPCQPCPGGGRRWYPGMIAGRVIGRIFGGRCR